ncbi:MAG: HD domain-containing protein [Candidatus Margulisbacteria bacterium]|nr:HD domain-containing protein [Candidatus Margulisiibacteriota bacterium]
MLDRLVYRLKQFYFSMFSVYDRSDEAFARSYLNNEETALFNQLPRFEKKHAVVVARKMLELALYNPELDPQKLVKLGLLHDIGKLAERNSILTKSILVIIRFLSPGLYDWLADRGRTGRLFRRFYVHKHHGAIGADMLAKIGVSGEFLSIIKKHDPLVEPFGPDDPIELKILQQADSTY